MADPDVPVRAAISIDISEEGLAATHPLTIEFPRAVAPTAAGGKEHNSLRDFLAVVGCAMFPDVTFQFDSSLVGPDVRKATRRLAQFREQLKDVEGLKDGEDKAFPPIALFGHADPIGELEYNSKLSARRALCIYGMLLHKVELWEELFKDKSVAGDVWGDEELNTMLDEVGFAPELPKGSTDEVKRKEILARLKKSSADRARLFSAYMDAVCVQESPAGDRPFVLKEEDFLDRGKGKDHKGAVQGCGEFNPVLILSQAKQDRFKRTDDKLGRNAANEPNRRVLAFLFKPGTRIVPAKWPCPSVKDKAPHQICDKRLWKDAKQRRLVPDQTRDEKQAVDRAFKSTGDTMGCRFYHAFAQNSPCEGTLKLWVLRVGFDDDLRADAQGKEIEDESGRTRLNHPLARKRYVVTMGQDAAVPIVRGRTDENGGIRLPVFDEAATMSLKIDAKSLFEPADPDKRDTKEVEVPETEFIELTLAAGSLVPLVPPDDDLENGLGARQRLSNLGYGPDLPLDKWTAADTREALNAFQRKHKVRETGVLDAPTLTELRKVHGS